MDTAGNGLEVLGEDECLAQGIGHDVTDALDSISEAPPDRAGVALGTRAQAAAAPYRRRHHLRPALRRHQGRRAMTSVLIPQTGESARADQAGPGCGCCLPPPDASLPEGRQRALAELQARRDALERRLEGLR